MTKPAPYIITTGGFDTDSKNMKEAEKMFTKMKKQFPNTEYAIYKRIKTGKKNSKGDK